MLTKCNKSLYITKVNVYSVFAIINIVSRTIDYYLSTKHGKNKYTRKLLIYSISSQPIQRIGNYSQHVRFYQIVL